MPSVDAVTTWLEVLAVVLLIAAAAVLAWSVLGPAAGLAAGGVSSGAASAVLSVLTRARGRK